MTPVKYESDAKNQTGILQNEKILNGEIDERSVSSPHYLSIGVCGKQDKSIKIYQMRFMFHDVNSCSASELTT